MDQNHYETKVSLKPCPFCGNAEPEILRYGNNRVSTQYQCGECGCNLETSEEWGHGGRWDDRPLEKALEVSNLGLRRRIHILEGHNQNFERCESGWCNPCDCGNIGDDPATDLGKLVKWPLGGEKEV